MAATGLRTMLLVRSAAGYRRPAAPGRQALSLLLAAILANVTAVGANASHPTAAYPANPAVAESLVCVADEGIHCLERDALRPAWSALHGTHTLEPVIAGDRLFVGTSEGVYALALRTGAILWHHAADGLTFSPTVAATRAYISDRRGRLTALDVATGEPAWQREFRGWSYPPAALEDVLVTGGRSRIVRGLDPDSGRTLWRLDLGSELVYRPIDAGSYALVTTFAGQVAAIGRGGRIAWRTSDPVASITPAIAGERALFGGLDGAVRARSSKDGELLWTQEIGSRIPSPPSIGPNHAALVDRDGRAAVLRLSDGRLEAVADLRGAIGVPIRVRDGAWIVFHRTAEGDIDHRTLVPAHASSAAQTARRGAGPGQALPAIRASRDAAIHYAGPDAGFYRHSKVKERP
ncbi:MAG: PQQ-binding-like beta-propeller repeat protein [Halofilum sp. (in: g-proteobacteria)]